MCGSEPTESVFIQDGSSDTAGHEGAGAVHVAELLWLPLLQLRIPPVLAVG